MQHGNGGPLSKRTSWIPRDDGIPALKAELSRFHVTDGKQAKTFEALKSGIIGFTEVTLGNLEIQAVLAAPRADGEAPKAFLISSRSEASLCEVPALIGVNLKQKRLHLEDETGKPKYVFQVGILVLQALKTTADRESKPTPAVQSLRPPSVASADPGVDLVSDRLQMTVVISSSDPAFSDPELRVLASELKCVMSFQESAERSYYYLVIGEDECEAYRLYMDSPPQDASVLDPNGYLSVTLLKYRDRDNKDRDMLLCREV